MAIFPDAIQNQLSTAASFAIPGLTALKSLLTKPLVGGQVPLDLDSVELTAEAQVATQLLVDIDGDRKIVNDNIAPGPRSWNLKGTIFPIDLGLSSIGGAIPFASGVSQMLGQGSFGVNQQLAAILWDIFENRKQTTWRDADGKVWDPVAIERLSVTKDPAVQNRVLVQMTIKEIRIQSNIDAIVSQYIPSGFSNRSAEPFGSGITGNSRLPTGTTSLGNAG